MTTQTSVKTAQTSSRVHAPRVRAAKFSNLVPAHSHPPHHPPAPPRLGASVPADSLTAMRHISSGTPTMTVCPSREPWPLCQPGAISTAIRLLAQIWLAFTISWGRSRLREAQRATNKWPPGRRRLPCCEGSLTAEPHQSKWQEHTANCKKVATVVSVNKPLPVCLTFFSRPSAWKNAPALSTDFFSG